MFFDGVRHNTTFLKGSELINSIKKYIKVKRKKYVFGNFFLQNFVFFFLFLCKNVFLMFRIVRLFDPWMNIFQLSKFTSFYVKAKKT